MFKLRCYLLGLAAGCLFFANFSGLRAADKNGVSPQAISLPTGPGSIQGLGESFQPQLNTGSGSYTVKLEVPPGSGGHTPEMTLRYNTGSPNGWLGLGWGLSGITSVSRNTDDGVPYYIDASNGTDDDGDGEIDNPQELDRFTGMDQEELVQLDDGSFRCENEATFLRYQKSGNGWEARSKDGTLYEFGKSAAAQIESGGRVFRWQIERITDLDGNFIIYDYTTHVDSPGQKYPRTIRWGQAQAFFAAVFTYETGRPDIFTDFRSGFEVRTGLRLTRIDIISQGVPATDNALKGDFNQDGSPDALVRRYVFEYHGDVHLSLLKGVTKFGKDGATTMPAVTFDYSRWIPPDNVAASVITDGGAPPDGLNSESVEIIDMNGDGLPDVLSTTASQHRVQLNRGMNGNKLIFGPSQPVGNAPSIDLASAKTHLADSTADGTADLMVRAAADRFFCFDNTSNNAWTSQAIPLRNTDTWPLWPFDGDEGLNSRSLDLDHNRANDILHTGASGLQLWMLLRGQYTKEIRVPPLLYDGKVYRLDLPGAHVADINADRLMDLVLVEASRLVYFPNRGRGSFGNAIFINLNFSLIQTDIPKAGFSDVDGDGMVDLTVVRPSSLPQGVMYWLNRFQSGLVGPKRLTGLPALGPSDALRWADMNGNGSSDILISNSQKPAGQRMLIIDLVGPGVRPYLLSHVDNGIGLKMEMSYESSASQMIRAATPWSFNMPLTVPVLAQISEDDSRGNVNTRAITYRDPYYDPLKQEFRGFREAELRDLGDDSIETQAIIHRYDTGALSACLKGKLIATITTDEVGAIIQRAQNNWSHRTLAIGIDDREVCYPFMSAVDTFVHEKGNNPAHLLSEMQYDDFGNEIENKSHGVFEVADDETFITRQFELRPAIWLMGLKTRETIRDRTGRIASDNFFQYDARGHVIRREVRLESENRNVVSSRSTYDASGNLIEVIDANGHRRTFTYDSLVHAFPVLERVHLEDRTLEMSAEIDLGTGTIIRAVNFSGAQYTYEYDALARLTRMNMPGGAAKRFDYHLDSPISHLIERTLEGAGGETFETFTYFDAYGRKLGTKSEAEGGKWRYQAAVRHNRRKLVSKEWLPLETATPGYEEPAESAPHEQRFYDAMARPLSTIHPDGSSVRNIYEPLTVHFYDENDTGGSDTPRTVRRDGLERVVEVVERNGNESYTTAYQWSTLGDLIGVRDAQGNTKTMVYDTLRRKIQMNDSDRGILNYTFDDGNNLIRTVDARGQIIEYGYDFANRMAFENHTGPGGGVDTFTYFYDAPSAAIDLGDGTTGTATFTAGRLAKVVDPSGETHFSYDERGNSAWTVKRIREPHSGLVASYRTQFTHDLLDRLAEVIYPDNDRVRYTYNAASFVESIDGGPQGNIIVKNLDYEPSGEVSHTDYGNGVEGIQVYDARDRMSSQAATGPGGVSLLDMEYAFDPVSNLSRVIDHRPFAAVERDSLRRNTQVFVYDDLNRLVQSRYAQPDDLGANLGQIDYGYDAIGNLIERTTPSEGQPGHIDGSVHLGTLTYAGGRSNRNGRPAGALPGPHAVTGSASGRNFSYDANGNMSAMDGAALTWDVKDQLIGYHKGDVTASYLFDYTDRRVAKSVATGQRTDDTLYVDQYFEERPGHAPVKHVFSGAVRIAKAVGAIDPTRERVARLRLAAGWNALSLPVETGKTLAQVFGQDAAFYTWGNGSYQSLPASRAAQTGEPLWVFVPTARLLPVRGAYNPSAAAAAVPAGGAYVAWPRLEGFVPAAHLGGAARIHVHDASSSSWLLRDPSLPSFLQDAGEALPAAGSFWITAAAGTTIQPAARENQNILFYIPDHLGSTSATTDRQGALVEELAYYPFGEVRNRFAAAAGLLPVDYDFTGKETDDESGLVYHGARFYNPSLGRFVSADPLYSDPAGMEAKKFQEFLANPQKLDLYSYVLNNPMRYSDKDGLDEESKFPTIRLTAEEIKASGNRAYLREPMQQVRGWIRNPLVTTGCRCSEYHDWESHVNNIVPHSRWRKVYTEFTIKGPDGAPVKNHTFTIGFVEKEGTSPSKGESIYTVQTDSNGKVKMFANVPYRGGEVTILSGYYDKGDVVKEVDYSGSADFKRTSSMGKSPGADRLDFEVNIQTSQVTFDGKTGEAAQTEIKQTR